MTKIDNVKNFSEVRVDNGISKDSADCPIHVTTIDELNARQSRNGNVLILGRSGSGRHFFIESNKQNSEVIDS